MKSGFLVCSALGASAVLLTVIQVPFSVAWLAWVALVPFILVCSPRTKPARLALFAYPISLAYWFGNLYWLAIVTVPGWLVFCAYLGLYWPALALCIRYCRMKKIPLFLAVPVLFVGAEALQGWFFTGFSWRFLAHSQFANIRLIQIADIFGAAGVSFLVAMANGMAAQLIIAAGKKNIFKAANFAGAGIVAVAIIAVATYGNWRIGQSAKFIESGPLVASVQTNFPQKVKESGQAGEQMFAELLRHSSQSAEASAELIVWPETMVQATLDERVLLLLESSHPYNIFDKALSEHSKNTGVFVLAGAHGGKAQVQDGKITLHERYNSAYLYHPDGRQDTKRYDKIHLVPFGEFVPFRQSLPFLYDVLMKLTPYDYDYNLTSGKEYTAFEMAGKRKTYKFSVMICYEDTTPHIARKFSVDEQGGKRIDWLLNISNDGWFVRQVDGDVLASTELAQHAAICVFRAVENRLSVLRSVNTGISCLIDSLGRIRDGFVAAGGDFPAQVLQRKAVAGWFVDRISVDKRVTFFSKHGQWLDFCCAICFAAFIIAWVSARFIRPKHR